MIWLLVLILIGVLLCSEDGKTMLGFLILGFMVVGGIALALFILAIIGTALHII